MWRFRHANETEDTDDYVLSTDSTDAEQELQNILLQEPGLVKPIATVSPHSSQKSYETSPIDNASPRKRTQWYEEPTQKQHSTKTISRESRSTSRRRGETQAPVIYGSRRVPIHEPASSSGENWHRKMKQPHVARRYLEADDYKPFYQRDYRDLPASATPSSASESVTTTSKDQELSRIHWDSPISSSNSEHGENASAIEPTVVIKKERELFGIMWTPKTGVPYDDKDPPENACYNCWSLNHSRGKCPHPRTQYCRNCGRQGTNVARCLRCGPEFPTFKANERIRKRDLIRRNRLLKRDHIGNSREALDERPMAKRSASEERWDRESSSRKREMSHSQVSQLQIASNRPMTSERVREFVAPLENRRDRDRSLSRTKKVSRSQVSESQIATDHTMTWDHPRLLVAPSKDRRDYEKSLSKMKEASRPQVTQLRMASNETVTREQPRIHVAPSIHPAQRILQDVKNTESIIHEASTRIKLEPQLDSSNAPELPIDSIDWDKMKLLNSLLKQLEGLQPEQKWAILKTVGLVTASSSKKDGAFKEINEESRVG